MGRSNGPTSRCASARRELWLINATVGWASLSAWPAAARAANKGAPPGREVRPGFYILSTTSMPSSSNPCRSVRAVRSQSDNRLSRKAGVSAFNTGHCSKNVE